MIIMIVIMGICFAIAVAAIANIYDGIKNGELSAFGDAARLFPAVCAFAAFPILGGIVGIAALIVADQERAKRGQS